MKITSTIPARPAYTIAEMPEEVALALHKALGELPADNATYELYVELDTLLRLNGAK